MSDPKWLQTFNEGLLDRLTVRGRPTLVIAETLGVSLVFLLAGTILSRSDPLGLNADFPWGWFAPVLLALRHGSMAALFSTVILAGGYVLLIPSALGEDHLRTHLVGGLALILLIGEFSDIWRGRLRREQELSSFTQEQLHTLTREYYLLRLSHERLETELLLKPGSLIEALAKMEKQLLTSKTTLSLPQADMLLQLLSEYTRIESASLYAMKDERHLENQPIASIGGDAPLDLHDPLIEKALDDRRLTHVAKLESDSNYLVAVPLISGEKLLGLLVVRDMPFLAIEEENLQTLNLIVLDYAEFLRRGEVIHDLLQRYPTCPPDFAYSLHRLWRVSESIGFTSHMILFQAPRHEDSNLFFQHLLRTKRALDVYWLSATGDHLNLLIIVPLGSSLQAEGLVRRVQSMRAELHAQGPVEWEVTATIRAIDRPAIDILNYLSDRGIIH